MSRQPIPWPLPAPEGADPRVAEVRSADGPLPAPEGGDHVDSRFIGGITISSDRIETPEEARAYYRAKLARSHLVAFRDEPVTIVFERDATHLYSTEVADRNSLPEALRVERLIPGARWPEIRQFSLERARLMDHVLPALSLFTVAIPGTGASGHEKRMLYGPRLSSGDYMRVVLRPGPGTAWTCVSAYTVSVEKWLDARRAKRAKFPP